MSVDLDQNSAVQRLFDLITFLEGDQGSRPYPTLMRVMAGVKDKANDYLQAATDADETAALQTLAAAAERHVRPGAWPLLESPNSDAQWRELSTSLNIIAHLGTDASNGQRSTYADHAYAVHGASFVNRTGDAMNLTLANLAAEIGNIDPIGSTVSLQNPHHTNEPNLRSSLQDGQDDGQFRLTLDNYLRSFALQQTARVSDTP